MTKADIFIDYCLSLKYTYAQLCRASEIFDVKLISQERWYFYQNLASYTTIDDD